ITTIRARSPSEARAWRGERGGARRHQMKKIAASATRPAPRNRGRLRAKPTEKSEPLEHDQAQRSERDPWPDLELAAMRGIDGDRVGVRRQGDAVGGLELGDLV